eukprot:5834932-Alexandrium_andersonii.AAC.1
MQSRLGSQGFRPAGLRLRTLVRRKPAGLVATRRAPVGLSFRARPGFLVRLTLRPSAFGSSGRALLGPL